MAVCTVLIGCVFGTIVGALTGYFGGFFDNLIMRFNDILLSFPSILLALIFISLTKPGATTSFWRWESFLFRVLPGSSAVR